MTFALALLAALSLAAAIRPPRWWRDRLRAPGRERELRAAFPGVIDGLAAAVASGLSLQLAFAEVAPTLAPPLARAARRTASSLALGSSVADALAELDAVVPREDVAPLALVLVSFARSGGRVARGLERVGALLRGRLALEDERAALTAQTRASALVLALLAPLAGVFLSVAMPDYASTLFSDGRALLLLALVLEGIGVAWLWRIVRTTKPGPDLATFLDAVVVGLEAGLTFERSLSGLVQRGAELARPADVRRMLADLRLGAGLAPALRAYARGPVEERVAALVSVSNRMGSPLAHLLVIQADAIRESERRRAEATARRMPVLMLFPLALCILPALLVIFLGPPLLTLLR